MFELDDDVNLEDFSLLVEDIMCVRVKEKLKTLFNVDLTVPLTVEGKIICDNRTKVVAFNP